MTNEKESNFLVQGPSGALEVSINVGHTDGKFAEQGCWAILCHPHPVHGGTKENKVVTTLMRSYRDLGISVLRFNFRGVGQSEGHFDQGKGEFADLCAILSWLRANHQPKAICLAGFSFGSSIAARASFEELAQGTLSPCVHLVLVAPPIERYDYDRDRRFPIPTCVIQGGQDELLNAQGVCEWVKELRSPIHLIHYPQASHFFHGYLSQLKADLMGQLEQDLPLALQVVQQ